MKDAMPLRDFLHNDGMMHASLLSLMNDENDVLVELYTFFFLSRTAAYFLDERAFFMGGASSSSSFS